MFFGTPHYGMRTDDLEKMVHNDSSRHNLLRQLKEGSELLENQLEDLAHFWEEYKLNIISVYEQVPTPSVKLVGLFLSLALVNKANLFQLHLIRYRRNGEASEMVKRFSAQLFIPNEERVPANANHSNMVKFASAQDQTYKTVLRHLKKWVDSIDASNGSEAVPIILEARDEQ
jgi:hypothetical protein